jgi:hypothetical protein
LNLGWTFVFVKRVGFPFPIRNFMIIVYFFFFCISALSIAAISQVFG